MPFLPPDDDLGVVAALPAGESYTGVDRALRDGDWTPCGVGDWAFALRSPGGQYAARISPFDPAAPYSAALYREVAHTRQVPLLVEHRQLESGAALTLMEYLDAVPQAEAKQFHRLIAARVPQVAELVIHIDEVHARGVREQPWWGPLDDNPANVMRGADGRLVVTDLFYADGPNLYATARNDPDRVVRAFPEPVRRHMTEVPLTSSGGWPPVEQERMRTLLAEADARNPQCRGIPTAGPLLRWQVTLPDRLPVSDLPVQLPDVGRSPLMRLFRSILQR